MKYIYQLLLILILCSCEKEYPLIECNTEYPTTQEIGEVLDFNYLNGDWLLVDGTMFINNLDLDISYEIFHFGGGPTSSLRYQSPSYDFESITRYQTSWSFKLPNNIPGFGSFVMNNDSVSPYGLNVSENHITVIESIVGSELLLGGSSRPLVIKNIDIVNDIIDVLVQETYELIDGYNHHYYSVLTFKKIN